MHYLLQCNPCSRRQRLRKVCIVFFGVPVFLVEALPVNCVVLVHGVVGVVLRFVMVVVDAVLVVQLIKALFSVKFASSFMVISMVLVSL